MSKLAIKFKQCEKDIEKYCMKKKLFQKCEDAIWECHYPLVMNPLCLNSDITKCKKDWVIIKNNDDYYILYNCNCKHFLKNIEDYHKTILEPIKSPHIYYGSSLKKLEKILIKPKAVSQDIEYDLVVKYLDEKIAGLK